MGASASAPADGLTRTPTRRRSGFRLANGDSASSSAPPNPSSSFSSSSPTDPADYPFIAECLLGLLLFSGPHGRAAAEAAVGVDRRRLGQAGGGPPPGSSGGRSMVGGTA